MKRILTAVVLAMAVSGSAFAAKPDFYDRACLANQRPVKVDAGGYYYESYPSPDECRVHGTYYTVKLDRWGLHGEHTAFFMPVYYELTLARAEYRKAKIEDDYLRFTPHVVVTITPVTY